jgi:ribosome-associated protein
MMKVFTLREGEDHIPLNALLKALGWANSGSDANAFITDALVKVNGAIELQKRKKVRAGDQVEFEKKRVVLEAAAL